MDYVNDTPSTWNIKKMIIEKFSYSECIVMILTRKILSKNEQDTSQKLYVWQCFGW